MKRKITFIMGISILFMFFLSALTIVVPRVFNVSPYIIGDDHMAPEYRKNGLVFVRKQSRDIRKGDLITYYENQGKAIKTRRVLTADNQLGGYFVKGDQMLQAEMGVIHARNIIGEPAFYVPYLGILMNDYYMNIIKLLLLLSSVFLTLATLFSQQDYHRNVFLE
ncbi:hypothetical protein NRIC_07640 [Enterococcus florum]|uniref:Signal peptidase I n=1 Tax=Enterococcus florum TaxID=2480627 RepID=A0A4P5PHI3_9ENTE|nr:S26 family signal peptidase [Enterococcus florum]GCF92873.1 hypothetical protein NRIC_07640 [Enterococcus florum]